MTRTLTTRDLSALLQLSPRTIQRNVARRILPQPLRIGHAVRWRADDIERFLSQPIPGVDPHATPATTPADVVPDLMASPPGEFV